MFLRNYLFSFFYFLILGTIHWTSGEIDTCAEVNNILSHFQFRDPYVSIPIQATNGKFSAYFEKARLISTTTLKL